MVRNRSTKDLQLQDNLWRNPFKKLVHRYLLLGTNLFIVRLETHVLQEFLDDEATERVYVNVDKDAVRRVPVLSRHVGFGFRLRETTCRASRTVEMVVEVMVAYFQCQENF